MNPCKMLRLLPLLKFTLTCFLPSYLKSFKSETGSTVSHSDWISRMFRELSFPPKIYHLAAWMDLLVRGNKEYFKSLITSMTQILNVNPTDLCNCQKLISINHAQMNARYKHQLRSNLTVTTPNHTTSNRGFLWLVQYQTVPKLLVDCWIRCQ